ncbi:MAG: hypothetical protein R2748_22135 [Bryobacterales bacterium]
MEIAALMAPRPMLAVSATGDWTRNLPRNEGPALAGLYSLLGVPDRFEYTQLDAPHNYNLGSREAVYRFFGRVVLGDATRRTSRRRVSRYRTRPTNSRFGTRRCRRTR